MVDMIAAYVDGRPMPRSSSSLTSDASENRGGGCVKCCSGRTLSSVDRVADLERRQQRDRRLSAASAFASSVSATS